MIREISYLSNTRQFIQIYENEITNFELARCSVSQGSTFKTTPISLEQLIKCFQDIASKVLYPILFVDDTSLYLTNNKGII